MSEEPVSPVNTSTDRSVLEGKADILLPPNVFYNPVQEFNRDLTIAVISQLSIERWNRKNSIVESKQPLASEETPTTSNAEATIRAEERMDDTTENSTELDADTKAVPEVPHNITDDMKIESDLDAPPEPGKRYANGIRILEGLAASGLRSVRFALEVPGVREVVANDFDRIAYDYIKRNAERNAVNDILTPSYADASMVMYGARRASDRFDVVDLDPYGSPAVFLDAAVQSVSDGGILCVTCTDMAVLCGNATETCHAKYGSTSLRTRFCHEMAVRILLRSIEAHANRYSRYIAPLLSLSIDFYCRVFVRVFTGQKRVKDSATKISTVYHCNGCGSYALQPLVGSTQVRDGCFQYRVSTGPPVGMRCAHCNGRFNVAGPIWSAPIHDRGFVGRVIEGVEREGCGLGTKQRILGMLNVVCEELEDVPLYYDVDHLCKVLHCTAIGFLPMRSALLHRGFEVSLSHASKKSLKTNAPSEVVWDILRCWVRQHPVSVDRLQKGSVAEIILSKEPSFDADFSTHPDANPESRRKGLVRWQLNPERDWGPKPRATRSRDAVEGKKQAQDAKCREVKAKRRAENEARQEDLKSNECKRFRRGICTLGSTCRYSHAERSEILEKSENLLESENLELEKLAETDKASNGD